VAYEKYFLNIFLFFISNSFAQIEINKPIVFIDPDDENRRIEGLAPTTDQGDLVNAKEIILNRHIYASAFISGDTLKAVFPVNIEEYTRGMKIYLKFPETEFQNVQYLKIDNLEPANIIRGTTLALKNDWKKEQIFTFIYSGSSFILVKRKLRECPDGFVEVNNSYCISEDEVGAGLFHEAVVACNNLNARLCTWAEWTYACQEHISSLKRMTNNYEWVDSGAVSESGAKVTGSGSCFFNSSRNSLSQIVFYRCCYVR
jgi:hypothetical protein